MARRACLTIGVSTVVQPQNGALRFAYLDGALFAARAIGDWALHSGFGGANVRIVDDGTVDGQPSPVTRERVQRAVDELFAPGTEVVDHLILAFCGHGLTDSNVGAISWLFSDSLLMKYRVLSDLFYTELLLHGVKHITLITDACREAPRSIDLMRLDAVRGIVVQGTQIDSPRFDRFAACQDGQLGYMLHDPTSAAPGKCVFSGVITDTLWGMEPAAIVNGVITTATFGTCVRSRTQERALEYHLKLNPQCLVDPEPSVLYDVANPPAEAPTLQPWPPVGAVSVLGEADELGALAQAQDVLARVRTDTEFRKRLLGSEFGIRELGLATASDRSIIISDRSEKLLQDLAVLKQPANQIPGKEQKVTALVRRIEADAVAHEQQGAAQEVQRMMDETGPRIGANVVVWGGDGEVLANEPFERGEANAQFRKFTVSDASYSTPILVDVGGGLFAPVVPYEHLIAVVMPSSTGDVFQAYGSRSRFRYREAMEAIGDFAAGRLGAGSIERIAGIMRQGKHLNPMLGVICAYLYRAIADYDSIRRMAFFYKLHGQAVPFDIALLGAMRVERSKRGDLHLHVPAVGEREPRADAPLLPHYATQATPSVIVPIGGRCPWLGLGWDYVKDPRPEWAALVEGLGAYAEQVRRSGTTVLPRAAAYELAQAWRLRPH